MKRTPNPVAALLLLAPSSAGGGGATPGDSPDEASEDPSPAASRPPFGTMPPLASGPLPSGDIGDVPDDIWQAVLDDLAQRVGEPVEQPTVTAAGAVTYNDGSLGCPEPGVMYTQALVEGYRVIVEVDGQEYDYRIGRSATDLRLCESGSTSRGSGND